MCFCLVSNVKAFFFFNISLFHGAKRCYHRDGPKLFNFMKKKKTHNEELLKLSFKTEFDSAKDEKRCSAELLVMGRVHQQLCCSVACRVICCEDLCVSANHPGLKCRVSLLWSPGAPAALPCGAARLFMGQIWVVQKSRENVCLQIICIFFWAYSWLGLGVSLCSPFKPCAKQSARCGTLPLSSGEESPV